MKKLFSLMLAITMLFASLSVISCTPEDRRDEVIVDSVSLDSETGVYRVTGRSVFDGDNVVFEYKKQNGEPKIMVECIVQIDYLIDEVTDGVIYPETVTVLSDMIEFGKVVCLEELLTCMISDNQLNRELLMLHFTDSLLQDGLKTGDQIKVYYKTEADTNPKTIWVIHLENRGNTELTDEEKELVKDYTLISGICEVTQPDETLEN